MDINPVLCVLKEESEESVVQESDSDLSSDKRFSVSEDSVSGAGEKDKVTDLPSLSCARLDSASVKWVSNRI